MKELHEQVAEIHTRLDLVAFIDALRNDLKTHPGKWENSQLDSFLAALSSWTEDMDGFYQNKGATVPLAPTWQVFGEMLAAARIYE